MVKDMVAPKLQRDEKKGKPNEIKIIRIEKVENGWTYRVEMEDNVNPKEYVYKNIADILSVIRNDLSSPHLRGQKKVGVVMHEFKHKTLRSESGGLIKNRIKDYIK